MTTIGYPQALIALTPDAQWSMTNVLDYGTLAWFSPEISVPSQAQCDAQIDILKMEEPLVECKNQATKLLYETDWTTIADVADPAKSNPYLLNQSEFASYRSALRQLAVYPVATPVWPVKPTEQWSA